MYAGLTGAYGSRLLAVIGYLWLGHLTGRTVVWSGSTVRGDRQVLWLPLMSQVMVADISQLEAALKRRRFDPWWTDHPGWGRDPVPDEHHAGRAALRNRRPGRRQEARPAGCDARRLLNLFGGRILAFDAAAARHYAALAVAARSAGKGFPTPDGSIAAIAAAHGFTVATRDVAPFAAAGITVIIRGPSCHDRI